MATVKSSPQAISVQDADAPEVPDKRRYDRMSQRRHLGLRCPFATVGMALGTIRRCRS